MENMARQRRNSRRKGCRRNRRRQSGGEGMAYSIGGTVTGQHVINNYDGAVNRFASCEDASRPGYLTGAAATVRGGLPGFAGGRRSASMMKGGRYSFVPEVVGGVGMMMPRYSGCGSGLDAVQNPLNQGNFPASVLTAPPPHVPAPRPMVGGVGGVDSMVYEAPRGGYTTAPSNSSGGNAGVLADGKTPFLVNVPYSAQPMPSSACLKTGGSRKNRNRKGSRRANRKGSRKANRKGSRKNRNRKGTRKN
jgi:hypothetical protein